MINGITLRDAIISGGNNIAINKVLVDELNVFPVPDGDTGTNMSMTMAAALKEIKMLNNCTVADVAQVTANALLRGARGNSGVILSLLFRGFSKGFTDKTTATGEDIANALTFGVESAYKAVMKPTEGTILTVSRLCALKAKEVATSTNDPVIVFEKAYEEALVALENTPELLPILKKAGVVDAGGKGYVMILEGMLSVFKNNVIIEGEESNSPKEVKAVASSKNIFEDFGGDITFTYCTEFIIDKFVDEKLDSLQLRAFLESNGDSVVVVDDNDIIKVHVHTDNPGKALQKGLEFGSLTNIKIENMREQNSNKASKTGQTQVVDQTPTYVAVDEAIEYGFVAVCAGTGLQELFINLGVDNIVSGGQTMNPSTTDILAAIEATPAKNVFVLPNNKNIIMAAEQAIPLSDRNVCVLQTKTIPQGMAAMLAFDPESNAPDNQLNMMKSAEKVSTGQITFAARDSEFDGHKINKNEIIILENGKITNTEKDMMKATIKLVKSLVKKSTSFVTLIHGEDITEQEAQTIFEAVKERVGNSVEVVLINGGQPVYYFIISVE